MSRETWTDNEIRSILDCFRVETDKVKNSEDLKAFIKNMTPAKAKKLLEDNLQSNANRERDAKAVLEDRALQKEALKTKLGELLK